MTTLTHNPSSSNLKLSLLAGASSCIRAGYPSFKGARFDGDHLRSLIQGLEDNGLMKGYTHLLSGLLAQSMGFCLFGKASLSGVSLCQISWQEQASLIFVLVLLASSVRYMLYGGAECWAL